MEITIIIGILSSTLSELVTALNKKLQGTVIQGDAAFLIALVFSLIGGLIKVFYIDGTPIPHSLSYNAVSGLFPAFAQIWTVSQIYFLYVTQKLNMNVQTPSTPVSDGLPG